MTQIRLGDLLIRAAVVNEAQLNAALAEQKQWGGRLGTILVRMGALSEDLLVKALSRQLNIPRAAIGPSDQIVVPEAILARVDRATCEKNVMVPVAYVHERRAVQVAIADPFNVVAVDDFGRRLGLRVETLIAGETQILQAIGRIYAGAPGVERAEAGMGFMDNSGRAMGSGPVPAASPWSTPPTQSAPPAPPWSPPPTQSAPPAPQWSPPPTSSQPVQTTPQWSSSPPASAATTPAPPSPWPQVTSPQWSTPPTQAPSPPPPPPSPPGWSTSWAPPPNSGSGPTRVPQPGDDLRALADQQLKAVRALVELLVEKGVISRAELQAWLGR